MEKKIILNYLAKKLGLIHKDLIHYTIETFSHDPPTIAKVDVVVKELAYSQSILRRLGSRSENFVNILAIRRREPSKGGLGYVDKGDKIMNLTVFVKVEDWMVQKAKDRSYWKIS